MSIATGKTWVLSPAEFAATKKRVEAINKRATMRGFTGRIEVVGTPREVTETDEAGLPRTHTVIYTAISGEAPRYNGWTFLAAVDSIESDHEHAFVLRAAPGVDASSVDRSTLAPGRCEHCRTVRANRRYTYLIQHAETGECRQVGSTCVQDFTGWEGKPVFIRVDDLDDELRDFIGNSSGKQYSPETVVATAWAISRCYGWAPSSFFPSTRSMVSDYLYGLTRADEELRREVAPEISAATDMAKTIITALSNDLGGDAYVTNLKVCLGAPYVEDRHLGIVVSAVSAYERMTGETARREAEAEKKRDSVPMRSTPARWARESLLPVP